MKKLLAMVLALVMTLSLAVSANAAFKDADKVSASYEEAVAVLNGMGVFQGYEDGSFQPQGDITRAEVATIIYRIYTQDLAKNDKSGLYASYNKFSDMTGAGWAAGYIGYCANAEFVKGYPDGTFKPSGNVTGYEVLAMILRAVGYDKNNEFSGADWALHVAQTAQQLGVLDNVAKTTDLNAPASRELVAELLFQGIQKAQVTYTPAFGYVTDKVIGAKNNSLGEKNFKLDSAKSSDKWGRPATKWTYTTGDKATTFVEKPNLTYTKAVTECDVAHDANLKSDTAYTLVVNGDELSTKYTVNRTDTTTKLGAQGRLTEVYDDTIVMIDTFLAKVTYVAPAAYDAQGHLRTEATIKMDVYDQDNGTDVTPLKLTNGEDAFPYAVGDYVLVNAWTKATNDAKTSGCVKNTGDEGDDYYAEIVGKADSFDGAQSVIYWNSKQHNVDGKVYDDAEKFYLNNAKRTTNKYTWFVDQYGNLIGNIEIEASSSYGVINSMWWAGNAADGSGVAKANVTYVDGTTGVIDVSEMTYNNANAGAAYVPATGDVVHSTVAANLMMVPANEDRFYVDSSLTTNTDAHSQDKDATESDTVNHVLNGHLFQFTTKDNGTVSATEVGGNGSKFFSANLTISKNGQYKGGKLIVDSETVFLVRSGDGTKSSPYTFKSITGVENIDNYALGEVDFVDLNNDKVADYVYITADAVAAKVTSLFYYENGSISYNASTKTYTIPGYIDGVKGEIYADGAANAPHANAFVDALEAQNADGALYKVALKNNTVNLATMGVITKDDVTAIATIGTAAAAANVTAYDGYDFASCYSDYDDGVKVVSIKGADGDKYSNHLYTDAGTPDAYYTISGNGTDGLTKMPLALKDPASQNVIVVYYDDGKETSEEDSYALALQVYAVDQKDSDDVTVDPSLKLTSPEAKKVQATYKSGSEATDIKVVYYYRVLGQTSWKVMEEGHSHSYPANGSETFEMKTVPNGGSTETYEVYAEAISTASDSTNGDVLATSKIVEVIA